MRTRTRQANDQAKGDYMFQGFATMTQGVDGLLQRKEALTIITDLQNYARTSCGIDYLQVYKSNDGHTIRAIDASPYKTLKGKGLLADIDYHHFTLMLPNEY